MGKRAGLLRSAAKPHLPGDAGGDRIIKKKKIKKKKPLKIKKLAKDTAAAAAASTTTTAAPADDMFAMALPTAAISDAVRFALPKEPKRKRKGGGDVAMAEDTEVDRPAAFEDESKDELFRRILSSAKQAAPVDLIPADVHRAHVGDLKRRKQNRAAQKAERFSLHLKC